MVSAAVTLVISAYLTIVFYHYKCFVLSYRSLKYLQVSKIPFDLYDIQILWHKVILFRLHFISAYLRYLTVYCTNISFFSVSISL